MGGFTSVWHWLIVLFVIILLFGAKKIPELAKGLGSGIKNFKKAVREDEEEAKAQDPQVLQTKTTTQPSQQQEHKA
ncbi:twin-arginine translocase TatA/TatE family subunit [Helicobacter baculiformis]|uniref:Sec-independent protein translocase protein TatA n=1 Tax=Helicobacter baculiformis TaxID=427351 RepID=A0ABV7ZJR6_9HELI|nr:twin-arginine translocase TatA/TatE family subunit [Helicobacter baculiformis]